MGLFNRNKKAKKRIQPGTSAKISQFRTPYRKNSETFTERKTRRKTRSYASAIPSSKFKQKPDSNRLKAIAAITLSAGLLAFGIYSAFFSDWLLVENFQIEEEGTMIDDYQKMKTILQNIVDQNILLVNEEALIGEIRANHPEIDKIKIKKILPDTIKIEYTKFPTTANIVNIVQGIQKKFLTDSQGFLIEENMEQLDLPHIYIETTEPLEVRHTILPDPIRSRERLSYIINSVNLFEEKFGIKVLYADFKQREREVHLHTEKYFYVMLDMEKDLNRQIEKLKKALQKLDIYQTPLVYIDLRISGKDTEKVIYKRK